MAGEIPKNIKASLYIDGKPAEASLKNVEQVTRSLEKELKGLEIGTDAWNKKMAEVAANKKYLKEVKDEINGVGGAFAQLKQELGKVGTLAAGYLGFQFITSQFQGIIAGNAKLSDSLSDMRRAIGLTEAGVLDLNKRLGELDTRTSKAELRGIAIIAGKLGVARQEIVSFVEATDKLTVALGDELGDADQITTQLGKILNVFDGKVTGDNITRLGNAMIGLANAGVASAGFVTDFTQRLAPMADTANLGLGATLALGAGIEELGGRSESSSTAITKLLNDIASDLPAAAKIAKVPLEEFTKLFAAEPQAALLKYSAGLVANKEAFSEVAASLKDAGEEGARVITTIAMLGNNTQFFTDKVAFANNLLTDSAMINDAFALKNQNLGAEVDKLGKEFNKVGNNVTLVNLLTKLVYLASDTVKWIGRNAVAISNLIKLLTVAGIAWGTYRTYLMLANSALGTLLVSLVKGETVMALSRTTTIALAGVQALLTGNLTKAAQAMRLLNSTMAVNPIGAVLTAIVAVTTAFVLFSGTLTNAAKIQQNFNDIQNETNKAITEERNKINALLSVLRDEKASKEQKLLAIKELRDIMPSYLKQYSDEEILAGKATRAVLEYVAAIEQKAKAEITGRKLAEIDGKIGDIDTQVKNGYRASSTLTERLAAGFSQGNKMDTETAWKKTKEKEKADLIAQQKELRDTLVSETQKTLVATNSDTGTPAAVKSLDALKKKLEEVTKARAEAEIGSKTFIEKTAEMKALQKEIDKYSPSSSKKSENSAESARKKALAEFEKLDSEYKALNLQRLNDQLSANQKELKQEGDKYDALLEKERAFLKMKGLTPDQKRATFGNINELNINKQKAVGALAIRQQTELNQAISDLRTKLTDLHETELQKQRDQINKFYDDLERKAAGNESRLAYLKLERGKELGNAELREKERLEKEKAEIEAKNDLFAGDTPKNRLAQINKHYDDEILALKLKFSKELQATKEFLDAIELIEKGREAAKKKSAEDEAKEQRDGIIESARAVSDSVFTIMANNRAARTDKNISSLEKERQAELANKNLTEKQKDEINARYDAKVKAEKLKAWKADKAAAVAQAVINGALSVIKLLATPWAAVAAGIASAAQIAVIMAQPEPQFAVGGYSNEEPSGYVSNATIFNRSASGRPFMAGEAGKEWIAPNWMLQNPQYANIIGTLEVARREKRMYATGGFNSENSGNSDYSGNSGYNFARMEALMIQMINAQERANDKKVINVWSETELFLDNLEADRLQQSA